MKICITLLFAISYCHACLAQGIEPIKKPFALVEFFTSQGCSSCPPANEIIEKIYSDSDFGNDSVLMLSFHVDYWDDLGWKDIFSKKAFTERQTQYQRMFNSEGLYTPQFVVNGMSGFSGNNEARLRRELKAIKSGANPGKTGLSINALKVENNKLIFSYSTSGSSNDKLLTSAIVSKFDSTEVAAGENRGKVLFSRNTVHNYLQIPLREEGSRAFLVVPNNYSISDLLFVVWVQSKTDAKVMDILVFDIKE
ncbi:MAG: DUF1223 domain-containing protein [Bacteroidia bacterium]